MRHPKKNISTITQAAGRAAYRATETIERELATYPQVNITGGRYVAAVTRVGKALYEAWTDSVPFVYGPAGSTLQEALDGLEEEFRAKTEPAEG